MPLLPYALARPFLFGLDPEAAHELTLKSLATAQNTPLQWAWCAGMVDDPVTVAGIRFPNRVGLAAGLDKNAHCIDGLGAMGFGFVEVGTVTPKGQPGNPKPRMFRLPKVRRSSTAWASTTTGWMRFCATCSRPNAAAPVRTAPCAWV
jgi:dihydroorotate dehydrogenase